MSNLTVTGTPKSRARLDNEIEKCREEGNWQKLLQLALQMVNQNSDKSLIQFLLGESKLELYLELVNSNNFTNSINNVVSSNIKNLFENKEKLINEAEENLTSCLNNSSSPLFMDATLLLAKLYYDKKNYEKTVKAIEASGIEDVMQVEKNLPLRVMKLVTESFAIKGMALEYLADCNENEKIINNLKTYSPKKIFSKDKEDNLKLISNNKTVTTRILCLTKATDLTLRYLQNIEKQHGQYAMININNIMEASIQRAPLLYIKNMQLDLALNQYRSILNAVECKTTSNCRQIIARQLTEVIIRGVSRCSWKPFDISITQITGPWKPHRYNGQSLFNPQQKEEELLLLLLIAEQQAAANVVLERSNEFSRSRKESLNNVIAIYDLFTIAFTPLRYFAIDLFEKAMKFSFEVKHIWLQFGLSLLESQKSPQRCMQIFEEVARIDKKDPLPILIQTKICLTDLNDPELALELSKKALEIIKENDNYMENLLLPRCYLMMGIANAIIYEKQNEFNKSQAKDYLDNSIKYFKLITKCSPNDHLPYYHLALHYANQRSINEAILNLQIASALNPFHLQTIQLLIICLTSLKKYKEALSLCESALKEFPGQLLLLYIKANIEQYLGENGFQEALLTAKEMLAYCKQINLNNLNNFENLKGNTNSQTSNYCLSGIIYDTISVRMEQTLSEVVSIGSNNQANSAVNNSLLNSNEINQLVENATLMNSQSGIFSSQYSYNNISSNNASLINANNKYYQKLLNMQMQIWIMIIELFMKLDQFDEAEACLNEDCQQQLFGSLSHQFMFIKGKMCIARNQLLEAKILLQNCISINPNHAKALQQLGLTYHLLGNNLIAEKYLKNSLSCDANCVETWSIMGNILEQLDDVERAVNCHLTALKLEETEPVLPFNIMSRTVFD